MIQAFYEKMVECWTFGAILSSRTLWAYIALIGVMDVLREDVEVSTSGSTHPQRHFTRSRYLRKSQVIKAK